MMQNAERRTLRLAMVSTLQNMGFVLVERTEDELYAVEQQARMNGARRLTVLGHIGRTLGADIVVYPSLNVVREAYFVPYVGWKTRGWTVREEQYWDSRTDTVLASFVWDGRNRKQMLSGLKGTPYFDGFCALAGKAAFTPDTVMKVSECWANVLPESASWKANYTLAGWFGCPSQGITFPQGRSLSLAHYEALVRKQPVGSFLVTLAKLNIAIIKDDAEGAAKASLSAVSMLPVESALWWGEIQRASRLSGIPVERIRASEQVKLDPGSGAFDMDATEAAVIRIESIDDLGNSTLGSGFIVSPGLVLTNAHVVNGGTKLVVMYWDGVGGQAESLFQDEVLDLALLSIPRRDLPSLKLSAANRTPRGAPVYVIGSPSGLAQTLTKGIVSGYREDAGIVYVQTDAAVNPGNSGGPILDDTGAVIGIANMGIRDTEGLNFGIAVETIRAFITTCGR